MANETIELLKGYDPKKLKFPASFMEKYDGVPVFIKRAKDGTAVALTRQGEKVLSINHILTAVESIVLPGGFLVGELYKNGTPFKDISGKVRDTKQQHRDLDLYVFDASISGSGIHPWLYRYEEFERWLTYGLNYMDIFEYDSCIKRIPRITVNDDNDVSFRLDGLMYFKPNAEGAVLHSHEKLWSPGKRTWGTQKLKAKPTMDLQVVDFDEAMSKDDEPLGMVGRINVAYKGNIIGVGPGKLTHAERRVIWLDQKNYEGKIAEVQYMKDDSYDALRQPTFQRWRDDKNAPSLD